MSLRFFQVRPIRQARHESKPGGKLFKSAKETLWVTKQLKLLRHWPITPNKVPELGKDLDFSQVTTHDETNVLRITTR